MPNDLGALDLGKPDGTTQPVSVLDDYQRETRSTLVGWVGVEHDLKGRHAFKTGNTASRPLTSGGSPTVSGTIYGNTERGEFELYNGSYWQPIGRMAEDINYAFNGEMDLYSSNYLQPTGWQLAGVGSIAFFNTVPNPSKAGNARCVQFERHGANCVLYQVLESVYSGLSAQLAGEIVTFGGWAYRISGTPNFFFTMDDGIGGIAHTPVHSGVGQWEWLQGNFTINPGATLRILAESTTTDSIMLVDGIRVSRGTHCRGWVPSVYHRRKHHITAGQFQVAMSSSATYYFIPGAVASSTLPGYGWLSPAKYLFTKLLINTAVAPGVGKNIVYTLQINGVDKALTATQNGVNTITSDTNPAHAVESNTGNIITVKAVADSGIPAVPVMMTLEYEEVPDYT